MPRPQQHRGADRQDCGIPYLALLVRPSALLHDLPDGQTGRRRRKLPRGRSGTRPTRAPRARRAGAGGLRPRRQTRVVAGTVTRQPGHGDRARRGVRARRLHGAARDRPTLRLDARALRDVVLRPRAARAAISWAAQEDLPSAQGLLDCVASVQPLPIARMAGGNHGVAKALAAHLGDRVRLHAPVLVVRSDSAGVEVTVDGDVPYADRVVIAIPLPLLEVQPIEPGLAHAQRDSRGR